VASSAASVSLSGRSARISGWRPIRASAAAPPTMMPACGPPSSLSPEKHTTSSPAATASATLTAGGRPSARCSAAGKRQPDPRSNIDSRPCARASAASSLAATSSVNPRSSKFERCTLSSSAVRGDSAVA
jgi:hypothetical protein